MKNVRPELIRHRTDPRLITPGAFVGTDITTKSQDLLYQQVSGSEACSTIWSRRVRLGRENAEWTWCNFRIKNR